VGDCHYKDFTFKGMQANCLNRGERRVFRVDRILELKAVKPQAVKVIECSPEGT
jgi:predicted DNA-binding transcriptional regulator YafY